MRSFPTLIPQASCVPFAAAIWFQSSGSHRSKWSLHADDLENTLPHLWHAIPTCPGKCDALWRSSFFPPSAVHCLQPSTLQNLGVPAGSLRRLAGGLASTYARRRVLGRLLSIDHETEERNLGWDVRGSGLRGHILILNPRVSRRNRLGVNRLRWLVENLLDQVRQSWSGRLGYNWLYQLKLHLLKCESGCGAGHRRGAGVRRAQCTSEC